MTQTQQQQDYIKRILNNFVSAVVRTMKEHQVNSFMATDKEYTVIITKNTTKRNTP